MSKPLIDLHSHIAWHIDDGIQNRAEARMALEQAKNDGIVIICSTPHIICGKTGPEMFQKICLRQKALKQLGTEIGITICSGAEMYMSLDFLNYLDRGIYRTLNGSRYMLVEFDLTRDVHHIPYIEEYLEEMFSYGLVPLIAHVERFFPAGLDIDLIEKWLDLGCLLQTNRTSLTGAHGKIVQRNAMALIKNRFVHVVASDTHRVHGNRIEKLSDAYQIVLDLADEGYANRLFFENPLSILKNEEL